MELHKKKQNNFYRKQFKSSTNQPPEAMVMFTEDKKKDIYK